ncbi:DUF4279 domain-containing protein [Luteimonas sp. TWI1437]|uniref:DUF4279 domain-containing protein n=1 Tax=unclassified Luteimonas TaxID=2629088 RepID=UPI003208A3E9
MSNESFQISVYLKGDHIDPEQISRLLMVESDRAHKKGKRWTTKSGAEVVEKTGIWVLSFKGEAIEGIGSAIASIAQRLLRADVDLDRLPGVEIAYVDLLVLVEANEEGGGDCAFQLDVTSISALAELGLPFEFTAAVVAA